MAAFTRLVTRYLSVKHSIREEFLKPENAIVSIRDAEVRVLVSGVLKFERTHVDEAIAEAFQSCHPDIDIRPFLAETPIYEKDPVRVVLANGEVFDEHEYISRIFDIGALVLDVGLLPPCLNRYVEEARRCYAHGLSFAVISLSRTILEISLSKAYREGLEKQRGSRMPDQEAKGPRLYELIDYVFDQDWESREIAHGLRMITNRLIHGSLLDGELQDPPDDAFAIFSDTLRVVHALYEGRGESPSGTETSK